MMQCPNRTLVEAALLEQHRWEFNCEAMYRDGLRSNPVDPACFHDMLRSFGIARNLSAQGRECLMRKLPKIAQAHKENPSDWRAIFQKTGLNEKNGGKGELYIEGSKTHGGVARSFVSGMTKILWFAGTHHMPMFDTLSCNSVKPRGKTKSEKAAAFYDELCGNWDYGDIFGKLEKIRSDEQITWHFFPERFLDKVLVIKALQKQGAFEERFLMGASKRRNSYLECLPETASKELKKLVSPLSDALAFTKFSA